MNHFLNASYHLISKFLVMPVNEKAQSFFKKFKFSSFTKEQKFVSIISILGLLLFLTWSNSFVQENYIPRQEYRSLLADYEYLEKYYGDVIESIENESSNDEKNNATLDNVRKILEEVRNTKAQLIEDPKVTYEKFQGFLNKHRNYVKYVYEKNEKVGDPKITEELNQFKGRLAQKDKELKEGKTLIKRLKDIITSKKTTIAQQNDTIAGKNRKISNLIKDKRKAETSSRYWRGEFKKTNEENTILKDSLSIQSEQLSKVTVVPTDTQSIIKEIAQEYEEKIDLNYKYVDIDAFFYYKEDTKKSEPVALTMFGLDGFYKKHFFKQNNFRQKNPVHIRLKPSEALTESGSVKMTFVLESSNRSQPPYRKDLLLRNGKIKPVVVNRHNFLFEGGQTYTISVYEGEILRVRNKKFKFKI